jgi:hypothetical protein
MIHVERNRLRVARFLRDLRINLEATDSPPDPLTADLLRGDEGVANYVAIIDFVLLRLGHPIPKGAASPTVKLARDSVPPLRRGTPRAVPNAVSVPDPIDTSGR